MSEGLSVAIVLGTRPEIIKLAPIIHECDRRGIEYVIVHTGQHYSSELDGVFFDQLELPSPDYNLEIGSGRHGEQTGAMLDRIERVLIEVEPDVTIVQGDTNSTLAGALAASKRDSALAHVEAGLRSFDEDMPEEINRRLTDHVTDFLFPPTKEAATHLRSEGLSDGSITVTGNTIVDSVQSYKRVAEEKSRILTELSLQSDQYLVMTAHRAENVDDKERFTKLLTATDEFATTVDMPVIYPIHPRARENIGKFSLDVPERITLIDPLDFLDFLKLENNAALVLTDSGGVQEEACILRTPCITLRDNTERPETVAVGANSVVGVEPGSVVPAATRMIDVPRDWSVPFGDGNAAKLILDELDVQPSIEVRGQ